MTSSNFLFIHLKFIRFLHFLPEHHQHQRIFPFIIRMSSTRTSSSFSPTNRRHTDFNSICHWRTAVNGGVLLPSGMQQRGFLPPKRLFSRRPSDRIWTVPNLLCAIRICTTPVIGWLVIQQMYLPACLLFTFAGFTDFLDGLIARQFPSQRSLLGSIIDPVADKLLISTLFVTLTYVQLIPVVITAIVLCRDILLVAGGLILRYRMLEPPVTFRRFFDTNVSSIRIIPSKMSKLNTGLQLALVSTSLASPVFNFVDHPALQALQIVTACTTVYSGFQYLFHSGMLKLKARKGRKRSHYS